ncbi:MAG TPA: hypothetical protein DCQ93_00020 [Bacteroidetes bacterium]|nr:hypothetical protein [Bacteroidota bacterium]
MVKTPKHRKMTIRLLNTENRWGRSFLQLFEDDKLIFRLLLFASAFIYASSGTIYYQQGLTSFDVFLLNIGFAVFSALVFAASFLSKGIKKYLPTIFQWLVYAIMAQVVLEATSYNFSLVETMAVLVTYIMCSLVFRKPIYLNSFLMISLVMILAGIYTNPKVENPHTLFIVFFSMGFVSAIALGSRLRVQEKLRKSESLFKNIFNESADANLMTKVDDQKIITCNKRALDLFEVDSMEDLLGIDANSLQKHPFNSAEISSVKQQIKDNWGWSKELEYVSRKGKIFWGNLEYRVVEYMNKPHLQIRISDISERKRLEKLLLAEKQVLEMASKDNDLTRALNHLVSNVEEMIGDMQCSVFRMDEGGNELQWFIAPSISADLIRTIGNIPVNISALSAGKAAASKLTSYCPNVETNEDWKNYIVQARRHKIASCFSFPILSEGGNVLGVFEVYYKTTKEKPDTKDMEIINRSVNIVGVLMEKDNAVTKNKLSLERIQTQNEELKKTNAELDRFVYSTSHDLRAPLMNMLGLVDIVELTITDEKPKKYLGMMKTSVTNLDNTIKEILEYSKNTRTEVEISEMDLHSVTEEVLAGLQFMEGSDKVEKKLHFDMQVPFYSDVNRMKVILNNLISNAIKYRNTKIEDQFVEIDAIVNSEKAIITVRDNGIGINPDYRDKIFDMFFRATTQGSGSGLGLYILKETLAKVNGKISLETTPNIGSTFTIEIPNFKLK